MGKMDEQILAVDRKYLFEEEQLTFQGVTTDENLVKHIMKKFRNYIEVRRGDAEANEYWKQPIPYAIIRRGDDVFLYKRLKEGGEARLHDQLSIGVGGHMNRFSGIYNWDDNLRINLYRELNEELDIEVVGSKVDFKTVGLINDDLNDVGKVHIGILVVVDLPLEAKVTVKETDKLDGHWTRIKDLEKSPLFESLETWSQMALKVLQDG